MFDILHRVELKASAQDTFKVLTTREGLASWWTAQTEGDFAVGGVIKFRFGTRGGFDMKVLELAPGKRVLWEVVSGPDEWVGTKISFDLSQNRDCTKILFKHQGWKEPVEFMHHCSTKWAMFLMSIKELVETGAGRPFPNDLRLTHQWD